MTYQEIKDRLSKCELTLEKLKNGSVNSTDVKQKTEKLQVLRESYLKLLKEADQTAFINGNPVEYEKEDELKKYKDNSDVKTIKTAKGKDIKEQDGVKFSVQETKSIAKSVGKAVAMSLKTLGDEIDHMKAKNIEENSFEIYVQYKNERDDEFAFYIVEDTLHLTDFSFDKELTDVGVKPSGEAVVNVDVLANELVKHFKAANEMKNPGYASSSQSNQYAGRANQRHSKEKKDAHRETMKNFTQRLKDRGIAEAPDDMYYIKVPKTDKGQQNAVQNVIETFYSPVKFADIVDDDGAGNVIMYIRKEDFQEGMIDDLEGEGINVESQTNFPTVNEDAEEDAKNDADYAQGWHDDPRQDEDTDVGHQDDEPDMLGASAMETAEYAAKLVKKLQRYDQHDGEVDFPNWWQKKLILARDYISAAYHYLDSEEKQPAIDQLALEENINEAMSSEQREAMYDLQNILDRAAELGDEARQIVKDNFPNELSAGDAYDVFSFGTSSNSYDKTLETLISDIERTAEEEDMDMDEGRRDNDALYPDNPRLPEIKNLADKIVSMVKAEADKGELGYIKTMEEIRYQQEDDFERTPEWNKAKGIRADFDDYGSDTNEGVAKTQKAHGLVVARMKELAKQYRAGDKSVVAQLKDLTAKKKQLEKQLEKDVAGKNRGQQLDTSINEYRGVGDDLVKIIKDKAEDSGFSHEEETEEIIEFLQGIEFDDNGNIDAVYEEVTKEAAPGFKHDCAAKVVHETYGKGKCIPEKHTLVKEGTKYVVTHYDVLFESGKTVEDIPVSELDVKTTKEHWHKGYKKKKK